MSPGILCPRGEARAFSVPGQSDLPPLIRVVAPAAGGFQKIGAMVGYHKGGAGRKNMKEKDLSRIVRGILSSLVDLIDSSCEEKEMPPVLFNVRNGAAGFISLLDEVILDETIGEAGGLENVIEDDKET